MSTPVVPITGALTGIDRATAIAFASSDPSPQRAHPHRGASSPSRAPAARAADNHHLFIFVPFHMYSPREVRVAL